MSNLTGEERANYVHTVFGRIAKHYNLMNRLMTAGQDLRWRKQAIQLAGMAPGEFLLDLGAGTGDLGRAALSRQPSVHLISADFSLPMLLADQTSGDLARINADALHLPFQAGSFDVVVSGFLMRNVGDLNTALLEQIRILMPGGRIVILETTRPRPGLFSPFIKAYMRWIIPFIGRLVAGDEEAYRYLPASSEAFLSAEELADRMRSAGFKKIGFCLRMFGTIAIHWGEKG